MKKLLMKGVSLLLVGAMVVSLAACGKNGGGQTTNNGGKSENGSGNTSTTTAYDSSKYGVFRETSIDLGFTADDMNIYSAKVIDGKVNVVACVYDYSSCDDDYMTYKYITLGLDGSNPVVNKITLYDNGDDGVYSEDVSILPVEGDGEDYSGDEDCYDDCYGDYSYDNYYLNSVLLDDNGQGYAILDHSHSYSSGDYYEYTEENSLVSFDNNGQLLWTVPFDYLNNDEEWRYLQGMYVIENKLYIIVGGDKNMLFVYDKNGNLETRGNLNLPDKVTNNFGRLIVIDNKTYVAYYDDNWDHFFYAECDLKNGTVGKEYEFAPTDVYNGINNIFQGLGYDMCFSNGKGIFGMNIGDTESKLIMNFVNSDIDTYNMSSIAPIDDNNFIGFYYSSYDYKYVAGSFTKIEPKDVPDKKVIVVASASGLESSIKSRIIRENKTNPEYRFVIKDYSEYNSYDDYSAGITRLNNDLISGDIPDILITSSYDDINYSSLNSKGLFVNLDDLIKKDPATANVEYVEGVFNALRYDGKLYQMAPKFSIETFIGKGSMLNGLTRWDMDQFVQVSNSLNEDQSMFSNMTRSAFMNDVMNFGGTDFVDVTTGKCNFDSPEFKKVLEYAKTLRDEYEEDDEYWSNYWANYVTQYRNEKTVLYEVGMYSLSDINYTIGGYFGGDAVLIGFPTSSGNGSYINVTNMFSISAKSANQDAAWNFVKYYLTDEYQDSDEGWYLPVSKSVLTKRAYAATEKPYYYDENNQKVENNYTFWLGDEAVEYEPLTKAQADAIVDYICNSNVLYNSNSAINDIINEEAAAYFSGQKSVEDVANIIQSRVKVYVNENM